MQKPDAEGYVNIIWPSKSIPHGGMFHARISDPSNYSTKEFLKGKPPTNEIILMNATATDLY